MGYLRLDQAQSMMYTETGGRDGKAPGTAAVNVAGWRRQDREELY
jgi:hypothetical protein